jgi:hypothetical protein
MSAVFIFVYADAKYTAEIPNKKRTTYFNKESDVGEVVFITVIQK